MRRGLWRKARWHGDGRGDRGMLLHVYISHSALLAIFIPGLCWFRTVSWCVHWQAFLNLAARMWQVRKGKRCHKSEHSPWELSIMTWSVSFTGKPVACLCWPEAAEQSIMTSRQEGERTDAAVKAPWGTHGNEPNLLFLFSNLTSASSPQGETPVTGPSGSADLCKGVFLMLH